jgi:hypothetical protein
MCHTWILYGSCKPQLTNNTLIVLIMSPHVLCFFGDMSYFLVWLQGTNCVCWTIPLMSACWGSKCPPAVKAKLKEIQEAQKRGDLICVVGDVCSLVVWFQTESCVHIMLITLLIQSTIKYPGFYNGKLVLWLGQCLGDGTKNQMTLMSCSTCSSRVVRTGSRVIWWWKVSAPQSTPIVARGHWCPERILTSNQSSNPLIECL